VAEVENEPTHVTMWASVLSKRIFGATRFIREHFVPQVGRHNIPVTNFGMRLSQTD